MMKRLFILLCLTAFLTGCSSQNACSQAAAQERINMKRATAETHCSALYSNNKYLKEMQQQGAQYLVEENRIIIALPSDKLFEPTTADFADGADSLLEPLAELLKPYRHQMIKVYGNTDPIAGDEVNEKLSATQAMRVTGYLWTQCAGFIAKHNIKFIGNGENKPIATNDLLAGMDQNRNIMVIITPKKEKIQRPVKRRKPRYTKTYK